MHFVFFVTDAWVGAVRIDSTGVSCVNVWNHCVYTSSSTPIARMHSCVCLGTGRWEWMDGWRACIHVVCRRRARRRTDSRDAPSATIDIVRIERVSPASLSLSLSLSRTTNSFIHSFIHSFIPLRTNERTKGRTNERTTGRAREGRERDGLDRRVRSHPIARAREEVRASVSNARRIERIESRVHFKPPIHRRRSRRMRRGMNARE